MTSFLWFAEVRLANERKIINPSEVLLPSMLIACPLHHGKWHQLWLLTSANINLFRIGGGFHHSPSSYV
jgi:hypothetical protein